MSNGRGLRSDTREQTCTFPRARVGAGGWDMLGTQQTAGEAPLLSAPTQRTPHAGFTWCALCRYLALCSHEKPGVHKRPWLPEHWARSVPGKPARDPLAPPFLKSRNRGSEGCWDRTLGQSWVPAFFVCTGALSRPGLGPSSSAPPCPHQSLNHSCLAPSEGLGQGHSCCFPFPFPGTDISVWSLGIDPHDDNREGSSPGSLVAGLHA